MHIAAEIVRPYKRERPAYPALALTTDTSALTSYELVPGRSGKVSAEKLRIGLAAAP